MPDAHFGAGVPIGAVLALNDFVIPHAVGVDIGCGLHAVRLPYLAKDLSKETIKLVMSEVRKVIPLGFDHQKEKQPLEYMPDITSVMDIVGKDAICAKEYKKANFQLGTLGGGNHFIEFQKDEEGFLWFMIHSGSRNLGLYRTCFTFQVKLGGIHEAT